MVDTPTTFAGCRTRIGTHRTGSVDVQDIAVCCSVLQCAVVCCSVLQCVALCCIVTVCCSALLCVAV